MNDCWDTLRITATSDIVAIRNAYRELVKRYHPDTVLTPEEKLRYTDFCAGINQAYREAIEWAKHHSADSSRVAAAPSECFEAEGGLLWKAAGKLDSPFARRLIIGFLVLVLAGFAVLPYAGASLTRADCRAIGPYLRRRDHRALWNRGWGHIGSDPCSGDSQEDDRKARVGAVREPGTMDSDCRGQLHSLFRDQHGRHTEQPQRANVLALRRRGSWVGSGDRAGNPRFDVA
jgi:hypothetical protein